jgi:signal peptidase I
LGVGLSLGIGAGLGAGLSLGLAVWIANPLDLGPGSALSLGLILGAVCKLNTGLAAGLLGGEITSKTVPNEGIHRSAQMAMISGAASGLLSGIVVGLILGLGTGMSVGLSHSPNLGLGAALASALIFGPIAGSIVGFAAGLRYGGLACLQHLVLRLCLRYYDCLPRHYVDFLNYTAQRLFIRQVGGGYIFIHRLLQEHFASLYTASGAVQTPRNVRRRPWIAGCLSCNAAGIGQLYNGQPVKALVLYGLGCGVWLAALMLLLELPTSPWNVAIPALMAVSWYGYVLLDAILTARRQHHTYRIKAYNKWWVYLLLLVATAVAIPLTIRTFAVQPHWVTGVGMEDTLLDGDNPWVNRLAYRWHGPARGDIVVFSFPRDPSRNFLSRVIGLPGDHVEVRNHGAYVNSEPLNEPYVKLDEQVGLRPWDYSHWGPEVVPPGKLFVMGDNRASSADSRVWGFVDGTQVAGRLFVVWRSRDGEDLRWRRIQKVFYSEGR